MIGKTFKSKKTRLTSVNPVLSLKETGLTHRYLTVAGQHILNMTGPCDTCRLLFSYIPDVKPQIPLPDLSTALENGLKEIDEKIVRTLEPLLPSGDYLLSLRDVSPQEASAQSPDEYVDSIPKNSVSEIGRPFFSCGTGTTKDQVQVFELILPLWDISELVPEVIDQYVTKLKEGGTSTAVAFSYVHITRNGHGGSPLTAYVVHCLIDGHHKVAAAAKTNSAIRILSFLPVTSAATDFAEIESRL